MEGYDIVRNVGGVIAVKNKEHWKEVQQRKYDILLKRSEIPKFYWDIEFEDYKGELSKGSVSKCINYSKNCFTEKFDYVNLYLWSEANSSQKTAILCNIGKEAIKQGKRVRFVLAGTLIDRLIKNQGFNYNEEIEFYLKNLKDQDLLLIDDIFDSKKSIHWNNSDLIVAEYDRFLRELTVSGIKIVMTSNVSLDTISKKFGSSIHALIDRNFYTLEFNDSIKEHRKKMFGNIFDEDEGNDN